jgi:nucleoside-diphosphate-sugar epimerase
MRTVVIGGTGHAGSYVVPKLVEAGHEVVSISRGLAQPYVEHAAWRSVETLVVDREVSEDEGNFGSLVAALEPDAVVDLICYTPSSARHLVEALRGKVRQFIHCGTIFVCGHGVQVPTSEDEPRNPFGDYGVNKAAIESYLLDEAQRNGFPASVLHPGHIVGEGWPPLNPAGNFDASVFARLARGEEVALPHFGLETVHHVHSDDVAQAFALALENWAVAVGQSFYVVSGAALTLRGYAEAIAAWFGKTANLQFLPWDDWKRTVDEGDASATWEHIARSPHHSSAKATRLLGYRPRYTSLQAVQEAVEWLIRNGVLLSAEELSDLRSLSASAA